tara:strand:- start:941 stop:1666 length:726 start_codon:yes stop_codon:yes gene_type:complete
MWWMAVPTVIQGLGSIYGKNEQIKALEKQKQMGKYEKEYFKRMESEARKGDPMYQQKLNQALSPIRQQGQFMQQRATGTAIQQGLENSIIADELRKRASRTTMGQISQTSERMAIQNAEYRRQAQGRLDQARLSREEKLRGIAQQQAGLKSGMIGDVIGMGASLAGQYAGMKQPQLTQAQIGGQDIQGVYWDPSTKSYTDFGEDFNQEPQFGSFGEAFDYYKSQGAQEFSWKGKRYNTKTK